MKAVTDGTIAAANNKVFDAMVEVQELARARGRLEERTAIIDRLQVAVDEMNAQADDAETIASGALLTEGLKGQARGLLQALQIIEELSR